MLRSIAAQALHCRSTSITALRCVSKHEAALILRDARTRERVCDLRLDRALLRMRAGHHTSSSGMSIQRRSFQLLSPASASCTPLAPSRSVHLNGAPSNKWRMNISHSALKPLSYGPPGTSLQVSKKLIGCGTSGFHTGRGVFTRAWLQHLCRQAAAEHKVPSTWNVTRSSRRTRVHQELLIWAMTPLASWKVA